MLLNEFKANYENLGSLQKGSRGTPAYTRYINRWFGKVLASLLGCFNVSPNAVSLISGLLTILGFIGFLLFKETTFITSILLVFLLLFAYALDSADGQLARLLKKQSKKGEWLDHTLDAIKIPFGHGVAILFIVQKTNPADVLIIIYFFLLSLSSARFFSNILKTKLIDYKSKRVKDNKPNEDLLRSLLLLPGDYALFISFFILTFHPRMFFIIYTVWGVLTIFLSIFGLFKTWRSFKTAKLIE
jgi:phosphatidylglycerophosphate synthase